MAHRLIAEIAGEPAAEAEPRGRWRDVLPREPGAHVLEGIPLDRLQAHVGAARVAQQAPDGAASRFDALRAGEADERIAPEALAADHRLEQVGIGAAGEQHVDRERRVEIGARFGDDGDTVVARGGEPGKFCFSHDFSPGAADCGPATRNGGELLGND
jgi:hypothetical protein